MKGVASLAHVDLEFMPRLTTIPRRKRRVLWFFRKGDLKPVKTPNELHALKLPMLNNTLAVTFKKYIAS